MREGPVRAGSRAAFLILCAFTLHGQNLDAIATTYRKQPTPATRAAVMRFANAHPKDTDGALALLALGVTETDQKQFDDAAKHLATAQPRLPLLDDYAAYLRAASLWETKEPQKALELLETVWKRSPESPLRGKAALLAAKCLIDRQQPDKAVQILAAHRGDIAEVQAEFATAQALDAAGKQADAAGHYQWVYYEYPLSPEARPAAGALNRLRSAPGYPGDPSPLLLARGRKLAEAADPRAAGELDAAIPRMTPADQELARVTLGILRYRRRDYTGAFDSLRSLELNTPEADGERLYYVLLSAGRLDRDADIQDVLARLERWYPKSTWRVQALVAAANQYMVKHQPQAAQPLYSACFTAFPQDQQAAGCHWKYVWNDYLARRGGAADELMEHVRRFPASEKAPAALYFLARIAETDRDLSRARAEYDEIVRRYSNSYYGVLARDRLRSSPVAGATPSAAVTADLAALHLSGGAEKADLVANPATRQRLERARLLESAGLDDLAESELRFAGRSGEQPQVIAVALAELANHREEPAQGIRLIKHYAPDYLALPLNSATERLWKLAFPIPYRSSLEQNARLFSLDPFLVAALVRQESEFNPNAVSGANAYGLAQVMPATGRMLSRRVSIRRFRPSMLFTPEVNLRIGSLYLKMLLDQLQGRPEATLASYNAGKSRVVDWLSRARYDEPAEFVESIPLTETRNYVQSVLRNADVYRRLYAKK